jgi:predicted SAM-dependent methyltransferase
MQTIKLHLGCGWRNFGSDWIHIDGGDYTHLEYHDITNLPYTDDVVDIIYASHVIEYFNQDEIKTVLTEWHRVLRPGGILRIAVPDFLKLMWVYQDTKDLNKILGPLFGKMTMGNQTIYHKTVYDFNSLKNLLQSLGFCNIISYNWKETEHSNYDDHSQAYYPHMDKENGLLISLNVEATK